MKKLPRRVLLFVAFCAALYLPSVLAFAAQPGTVDPSFDAGRSAFGMGAGRGNAVLVQPDGKILVSAEQWLSSSASQWCWDFISSPAYE